VETTILATKKRKVVKDKKAASSENVGFEESLQRIERSVARLESGNLSLADALEEYERGIRDLKQCHELLERAERKIEMLTGVDADGNPISQPYEHSAASGEESTSTAEASSRRALPAAKATTEVKSRDREDVDDDQRLF